MIVPFRLTVVFPLVAVPSPLKVINSTMAFGRAAVPMMLTIEPAAAFASWLCSQLVRARTGHQPPGTEDTGTRASNPTSVVTHRALDS
jgi:hypothetical protein